MEFNFPLILTLAVAISGFIWLLDICLWASRRKQEHGDEAVEPVYVEYSKSFFPVLFVVFVLRSFIVEPFQIPSPSMVPTLKIGDFILVNKFTYGLRLPVIRNKVVDINSPKQGDIMVFFPPHEQRYFIKRVIGLPGDTIEYKNNQLFLNGEQVSEEFLVQKRDDRGPYKLYKEVVDDVEYEIRKRNVFHQNFGPYTVPPGHYFMMGDNRNNSSDSRIWGPVPEENIVGKAFAIWMHWESFFSLPSFSRVGSIQ